jgi:fibronectin type 3 domain-containing protein
MATTKTRSVQKLAAETTTMENMTTEEQISAIQIERNDARQDLHDTLTEVNAKVGRAEGGMRPDHVIESHPVGASLMAGALGFLFGSMVNNRGAGPVVIAALLGFAISKHASNDQS